MAPLTKAAAFGRPTAGTSQLAGRGKSHAAVARGKLQTWNFTALISNTLGSGHQLLVQSGRLGNIDRLGFLGFPQRFFGKPGVLAALLQVDNDLVLLA
jgi:hypothetical protein